MIYYIYKNNTVYGSTENEELVDDIAISLSVEDYEVGTTDFEDYSPSNNKYIIQDGVIILNPNYEAELEEQEKERIGNLTCTKRVFALMLQEMGVDYLTQLKPLIESNPQAQLEWELCIELERKNPLLDIMAGQLGITPQKLDALFKYANGEITIDEFKAMVADVNNSEATGEENSVIDEVTAVEDVNNIEE